jgi:hypothetical protein
MVQLAKRAGKPAVTFHADVYMPPGLKLPRGTLRLHYTRHALWEARVDRFLDFTELLPESVDVDAARLIEVTTDDRLRPLFGVYRLSLTREYDLVIVLLVDPGQVDPGEARVLTVYCNRAADNHPNLRTERYWQHAGACN